MTISTSCYTSTCQSGGPSQSGVNYNPKVTYLRYIVKLLAGPYQVIIEVKRIFTLTYLGLITPEKVMATLFQQHNLLIFCVEDSISQ